MLRLWARNRTLFKNKQTYLGAAQSDNVLAGQRIKRNWVNALLVDQDEALAVLAYLLLEVDDFLDTGIGEGAFGLKVLFEHVNILLKLTLDKFLALLGSLVEKARVDLGLLVLEGDVGGQDVAVLAALGHVWVTCAVVHDESLDELGVHCRFVLHFHDFDHVQVDLLPVLLDRQQGVDNALGQLL